MARESSLTPGTVIGGKYRVERSLGAGGMGVVFVATHIGLEHRVALKLLNQELAKTPDAVKRFMREARMTAKLSTDHVVRVTDVGETDAGAPYLAMELLEGFDLAREIAVRGRLSPSDSVDLILQACEGVATAHAAGLVHRDLKPANLFLARSPGRPSVLKVLDFGLSKAPLKKNESSITNARDTFGTPLYMSPEQIRSTKFVDARTDQHALAAILYEMITGDPPFNSPAVTGLILMIATAPPPHARDRVPALPEALDEAIVRAMAKEPDGRFADLGEFADAIAPFGGPTARALARDVRAALRLAIDASDSVTNVSKLAQAPGESSSDAVTPRRDLGFQRAPASHTDLTSSTDPAKRQQRSRAWRLGVAASFLAGLTIALIVLFGISAKAPSPGNAASGSPAHVAPAVSTAPASSASTSSSPTTADDSKDESPAGSASSQASASGGPPPGAAPRPSTATARPRVERRSTPKGTSSVLKVFGEP